MLPARRNVRVIGSLWVTLVAAVGLVLGLVVAPAATASGAGAGEASSATAAASASSAGGASGGGTSVDPVAYINAQNTGEVVDISAAPGGSGAHACAVTDAGAAYCWGRNNTGQLGIGTIDGPAYCEGTACSPVPVRVCAAGVTDKSGSCGGEFLSNVSQISAGGNFSCAVTGDTGTGGTAYCWGKNDNGQLGNGGVKPDKCFSNERNCSKVPVQVKGVSGPGFLSKVTQISAGNNHACAVTADSGGNAYCWGSNPKGQLGNGDGGESKDKTTPVQVCAAGVTDDSGSCDGKFLSNVSQVTTAQDHSCAVTDAGAAYCWGSNIKGYLGNDSTEESFVPVQVNAGDQGGDDLADVSQISAGLQHTCAVTDTGSAFCWGSTQFGQLGNGKVEGGNSGGCASLLSKGCSKVPVQVNGGDQGTGSLSNVSQISAGNGYSCAVTDAGAAYCWGSNNDGKLGNGFDNNSSVPVTVANSADGGFINGEVAQVSAGYEHTCAVTDTGAAYCWGNNGDGQLGNGTEKASSVPVVVAGQLSVVPNPVEFGEVEVGSSETKDVQVTSTFLTPVGLDSVKEEGSRASFEWQVCEATDAIVAVIDPGSGCVGVALFAPEEPGSYAISLLLEPYALNGQGQPTEKLSGSLEFSVSGNAPCVKDCGPVVLGKPNPVDFGSVALGQIATDSVRLVNDGDKTLRISKVTAADTDGEFSVVDPDECVDVALRPDQGCSMQVRFSPESAGSRAGVLQVTSNSKAKTNTIGLTGMGEAAVIAKPGKVRKLQAPKKKITSKKALVKWKEPKGEATVTKYQTRIKKCQQKNNGQWNCTKPKWQKWKKKKPVANAQGWIKRDLTQLQPGTKYKVQVRAWSGDNKGPKSGITFTTKRSGIPTKPGNG